MISLHIAGMVSKPTNERQTPTDCGCLAICGRLLGSSICRLHTASRCQLRRHALRISAEHNATTNARYGPTNASQPFSLRCIPIFAIHHTAKIPTNGQRLSINDGRYTGRLLIDSDTKNANTPTRLTKSVFTTIRPVAESRFG